MDPYFDHVEDVLIFEEEDEELPSTECDVEDVEQM